MSSLLIKPCYSVSLDSVEDFGPNPGQLDMFVYVPDDYEQDAAMVVALHGCRQQATDFDDETGLKAYADSLKFVLLFPEQRLSNNDNQCFNWFEPKNNSKHQGESGSIKNMILYAIDTYGVSPTKIFILGLSAGGSMAAVLIANYPQMFGGGAIIAGTPYNC
ncbi:MAG: extracellular catalytic domain type 1 short-chain-length polyhydroxyalkanoate depolymerase, partial [bacterium]